MTRVRYIVHSDVDENNVRWEFEGRGAKGAAISYARDHIEDETWVDRVEYDYNTEEIFDEEEVWCYLDEEDEE